MTASDLQRGLRENAGQVTHQLIQAMLIRFAIGMTRTVVPAPAKSEFGLERGSFLPLASFVVASRCGKGGDELRRRPPVGAV